MHLSNEQFEELFSPARNGLISTKYRWPNKTVPYQLSMNHTQDQRNYIERSLKTIESNSCVKFVRHTNETDYIEITVSLIITTDYAVHSTHRCSKKVIHTNTGVAKLSVCYFLCIGAEKQVRRHSFAIFTVLRFGSYYRQLSQYTFTTKGQN